MKMGHKETHNWRAAERLLDESSICEHWMTTKVRTVAPTDSIERARDLLKRYRINQLPVVSRGKLLGIVTERDIRSSLGLRGRAAAPAGKQRVQSVMSRPAIALGCQSTLLNAARGHATFAHRRGSHRSRRKVGGPSRPAVTSWMLS
jgi:CBS-domain-containing membrane protein